MSIHVKFSEVIILWKEYIAKRVKSSTFSTYNYITNKYLLSSSICSIYCDALTQKNIDALIVEINSNKTLSTKYVFDILTILKNIIDYATKKSLCNYLLVDKPKNVRKRVEILTPVTQSIFEDYLMNHITCKNLGLILTLYTGVRVGEICALKWEDIDLQNGIIQISKSLKRIQNSANANSKTIVIVDTPKSTTSIRYIPLPTFLCTLLLEYRSTCNCANNDYLLTDNNKYLDIRSYQYHFKKVLAICNIQESYSIHVLRHTFATRCVELGFDVKSLSEILGHADVETTLNLYIHPSMDYKMQNMQKLNDIFAQKNLLISG